MRGSRLDHLEELAEELIKKNPEETLVRAHMKAAGLRYTENAIDRLTSVLESLDQERAGSRSKSVSDKGSGKGEQSGKNL